jgi:hypothetical protein
VLVFVTEKKHLAEVFLGMRFNLRDAILNGALEVELHHYAYGLC